MSLFRRRKHYIEAAGGKMACCCSEIIAAWWSHKPAWDDSVSKAGVVAGLAQCTTARKLAAQALQSSEVNNCLGCCSF